MNTRPGFRFYAVLLVATVLTFLVHEVAHWLAGVSMGYSMTMSLNGATPIGGFSNSTEAFWVTSAGPVTTVLQGLLAFWFVRRRGSLPAYAFLFVAWFMRFAAMAVSVVHPNDEARMSLALGWGMWALPALVVTGLLVLTWLGSRHLKLGWKTNVASYLVCSAAFAAIVFLDAR